MLKLMDKKIIVILSSKNCLTGSMYFTKWSKLHTTLIAERSKFEQIPTFCKLIGLKERNVRMKQVKLQRNKKLRGGKSVSNHAKELVICVSLCVVISRACKNRGHFKIFR